MKKLNDIINTDDQKLRDDDHLEKPDITKQEFTGAIDELIDKHELEKTDGKKPISKFAQNTIDALNKLGLIILAFIFGRS